MANKIKELWKAGRPAFNVFLSIPSGYSAEVLGQAGWDAMTVDLQHGAQDYQSMMTCFQAMLRHPVTPLVRVASNEAGMIGKALDAGAYGVICPLVNTREDAERLASYCRYPPAGNRSNGAIRPQIYLPGDKYLSSANEDILVLPMIETKEAVDNIESILEVPGIDGIYIGPNDLGLSLGIGARIDRDEPEIIKVYTYLLAETAKRGASCAIHCGSAEYAKRAVGMGFRLCTVGNDARLMLSAADATMTALRKI